MDICGWISRKGNGFICHFNTCQDAKFQPHHGFGGNPSVPLVQCHILAMKWMSVTTGGYSPTDWPISANHPQFRARRHSCMCKKSRIKHQTFLRAFHDFIANFVGSASASPVAVPTCCSAAAIAQQLHSPGHKVSGPWAWPYGEVVGKWTEIT